MVINQKLRRNITLLGRYAILPYASHIMLKRHVLSDGFISLLIGSAHILDLVWVVSSVGDNIGRVTYELLGV